MYYDIFVTFVTETLKTWSKTPRLGDIKQILSQYTKTIPGMERKITSLQVSYLTYLDFMSVACVNRWTSTLTLFYLNTSLDLENVYCAAIFTYYDHGAIKQTGIASKKIPWHSLLNLAWLWNRARLAIKKYQK